jgi:hypothetical protein
LSNPTKCSYGLGIEWCPVIFAAFFFLDSFAGSVVAAVAGVVAAGVVVVTGEAAGAGAVVAAGVVVVVEGDAAGAGTGVAAVLGAAFVFGASSASTRAAGEHTNKIAAAATAIKENVFMPNSMVPACNAVR